METTKTHRLIELIGIEAMRKIVDRFGGRIIIIPTKRSINMKSRNEKMKNKFKKYISSGLTLMESYKKISNGYYMSTRNIMFIINNNNCDYNYKKDPHHRFVNSMRCRIYRALKGIHVSKKIIEYVGCTISELKDHIEKQFKPRMTWENYGEWHVDHIKPCALFNLADIQEQLKCFNYANLQPLWAKENFTKNRKYTTTKN